MNWTNILNGSILQHYQEPKQIMHI